MTTPAAENPQPPPTLATGASQVERAADGMFRGLAWRIWVTVTLAFLLLAPPETVGHPFFAGVHAVLLALAAGTTGAVLGAILRLPTRPIARLAAALAAAALALELALLAADVGLLELDAALLSSARAADGVLLSAAVAAFFVALRATAPNATVRRRCDRALLALSGFALALVAVTVVDVTAPATGAGARWLLAPTILGAAFYVLIALHGYGAALRAQPRTSAQGEDVPLDAILTHRRRGPALRIVIEDEPTPESVAAAATRRRPLAVVPSPADGAAIRRWAALHEGLAGTVTPWGARLVTGVIGAMWAPGTFPGSLGLVVALATGLAIVVADVMIFHRTRLLRRDAPLGGARGWLGASLGLAVALLVVDGLFLAVAIELSRPDVRIYELLTLLGVASRVLAILGAAILVMASLATLPAARRARQSRRANLVAGLAPGIAALAAVIGWLRASDESDVNSLLVPLAFGTFILFSIFAVQVGRGLADIADEADDERRAVELAVAGPRGGDDDDDD
ncbi:MAG: hypothetical protein KC635_28240 [Myxococcales bacterium]|nr:hypothetical protein [Myxococcales bacterium]MCB9732802.1 hypothetical protein [Deltaproteobacteria bacterium]